MSPSRSRAQSQDAEMSDGARGTAGRDGDEAARPRNARRFSSIREFIAEARAQLEELTGRSTEAVTSVGRTEKGWRFSIEVVELDRIPSSTSILGLYEVSVDDRGNITEYSRTDRYHRNQAGEVD